MRTTRRVWLALAAGALLLTVAPAMGESDTKTAQASFTAPTVVKLTLTGGDLDFGTLTEADYDRGYKELIDAHTLVVTCNANWTLTIQANTAIWTYDGPDSNPHKPSTDLQWKVDGSYIGLSTTAATVATGNAGKNLTAATVDFKVLLSYTSDPPGTYALEITYTLTAP